MVNVLKFCILGLHHTNIWQFNLDCWKFKDGDITSRVFSTAQIGEGCNSHKYLAKLHSFWKS